jgi:hypothetical protein
MSQILCTQMIMRSLITYRLIIHMNSVMLSSWSLGSRLLDEHNISSEVLDSSV